MRPCEGKPATPSTLASSTMPLCAVLAGGYAALGLQWPRVAEGHWSSERRCGKETHLSGLFLRYRSAGCLPPSILPSLQFITSSFLPHPIQTDSQPSSSSTLPCIVCKLPFFHTHPLFLCTLPAASVLLKACLLRFGVVARRLSVAICTSVC